MTETKNYFKQRVPGFIDPRGFIPADFEFTKTEELLEHPYIKDWMRGENTALFKKNNMIIVRNPEGKHFVIGYVQNPDDVDLPVKPEDA